MAQGTIVDKPRLRLHFPQRRALHEQLDEYGIPWHFIPNILAKACGPVFFVVYPYQDNGAANRAFSSLYLFLWASLGMWLILISSFHPNVQNYIYLNDKVMHFLAFMTTTYLCYRMWEVDQDSMHVPIWKYTPLILTIFTSIIAGGIGSEFIQSLLPYKTFQLGDILANLMGSCTGLYAAYYMEQRYRARCELQQLYAPLDLENVSEPEDDAERDPIALVSPFRIGEST